jgi:hypothetical protein
MGRKLRPTPAAAPAKRKRGKPAKTAGWKPATEKTPKSKRKKTGAAAKLAKNRTAAVRAQSGLDRSRAKFAKSARKTRPTGRGNKAGR